MAVMVSQHSTRGAVTLLGPTTSAVSGVSTHIRLITESSLAHRFTLWHFQVGSEGRHESTINKMGRLIISPFALWRHLIITRSMVVHVNTSLNPKAFWRDLAYVLVAGALRRRVLYQVHGGSAEQFLDNGVIRSYALRLASKFVDVFVVLSDKEKMALQRYINGRDVIVIRNAVVCDEYNNDNCKMFEGSRLRLVYIGRLDREKGLYEALDAVRILQQEHGISNISMFIAGSGPAEADLRAAVQRLGLSGQVSFVGPLFGKDKVRFFAESDIFVFPSYREGLPYAVLESLAAGTPLVVTHVGAIPEVIKDGSEGFIVEPRNARMIAEALRRLIRDRNLLRKMSRACVRLAQDKFDIKRFEEQLGDVYTHLHELGQLSCVAATNSNSRK